MKTVAVKIMKASSKEDARVKFLQEAAILGQFYHSNVVKLFGLVTMSTPVSGIVIDSLNSIDSHSVEPHKQTNK